MHEVVALFQTSPGQDYRAEEQESCVLQQILQFALALMLHSNPPHTNVRYGLTNGISSVSPQAEDVNFHPQFFERLSFAAGSRIRFVIRVEQHRSFLSLEWFALGLFRDRVFPIPRRQFKWRYVPECSFVAIREVVEKFQII